MNKIEWYKKLLQKLRRIENGELSLSDYIAEVSAKVEAQPEAEIMCSNVRDQEGISKDWIRLWEQIEIWYGDIKKAETGEAFLKRMQSTFYLCNANDQIDIYIDQMLKSGAIPAPEPQDSSPLANSLWSLWESLAEAGEIKISTKFNERYNRLKKKIESLGKPKPSSQDQLLADFYTYLEKSSLIKGGFDKMEVVKHFKPRHEQD